MYIISNKLFLHCLLQKACYLYSHVIFCFNVFGIQKWNIYVNVICTFANRHRSSPVAVRLIKHRPVPGRASFGAQTDIGRCVKRFSKVDELFRYRTVPGRSPLESYYLNFKPISGARPMCVNAGRAPSGHRTVPGRCHFTLNDPTYAVRVPSIFK